MREVNISLLTKIKLSSGEKTKGKKVIRGLAKSRNELALGKGKTLKSLRDLR